MSVHGRATDAASLRIVVDHLRNGVPGSTRGGGSDPALDPAVLPGRCGGTRRRAPAVRRVSAPGVPVLPRGGGAGGRAPDPGRRTQPWAARATTAPRARAVPGS